MKTTYLQLQSILDQSILHLEFVLDTLQRERDAMLESRHDDLLDLVTAKTERIDQLADLDHSMTTCLLEFTQTASMNEFLAMQSGQHYRDEHHKLKVLWEYYVALLKACRDKNMVNGNVVNIRLQRLKNERQRLVQGAPSYMADYDSQGHIHSVVEGEPETVA